MACSYSLLLTSPSNCGISKEYPNHVAFVTLEDCQRDIIGHLQSCEIRNETIENEIKLLLARAGIAFTFS